MPDVITLLVEDNEYYRKEIKNILPAGFPFMDVVEAADAKSAMQQFNEQNPNVIFMDIGLPEENGLSLTRKMKTAADQVTVIILTSYDFSEYRVAARESGADYFLAKGATSPADIENLVQSVIDNAPMKEDVPTVKK